jgi:hypothetical protein
MNAFYLRDWFGIVDEAVKAERGPFRGLRPTIFGRWFVTSLEPPVRMKAKAIDATKPGPRFSRHEVLARYKASHEGYQQLVRAAAAIDVNRVVGRNAIVKQVKMRLSTVLMVVPAHDRRHLWQAANVKRAVQGA